jgi:hypothetical protein
MAVRHKVHNIFFEIGACATDDVHFTLPYHLGETDAQFSGAHGAGKAYQHFTAFQQMGFVTFCGINQCGCIKVPVMVLNELGNWSFGHGFLF